MIVYSAVYKQNIQTEIDYIFQNSILQNLIWEKNICDSICIHYVENTDIIDVGANIGLISIGAQRVAEESGILFKNIHCFECNHNNFEKLAFNTAIHDNIHLYNFGLADSQKIGSMAFNQYNNGCSFINKTIDKCESKEYIHDISNIKTLDKQERIFISLIPLDSIIELFQTRVSIIKIDIEGFEYFFLLGAKLFLEKHRPKLIIEIMPEHYEKINGLLLSYEYCIYEQLGNENYIYCHI